MQPSTSGLAEGKTLRQFVKRRFVSQSEQQAERPTFSAEGKRFFQRRWSSANAYKGWPSPAHAQALLLVGYFKLIATSDADSAKDAFVGALRTWKVERSALEHGTPPLKSAYYSGLRFVCCWPPESNLDDH
jgi:hypothetical protein